MNCAAANLDIANGVARPQIFAFDTENALINVTGTASFASEQLDLTIDPESKSGHPQILFRTTATEKPQQENQLQAHIT